VEALREYGRNLGMAFQIADDVLDFVGNAGQVGKPLGNDLRQGVVTLPAIIFLESDPRAAQLERALHNDGRGGADLDASIEMIRASSAIAAAQNEARQYSLVAQDTLTIFPDSPYRQSLLDLATFVVERNK
jgi:geranylgeranyl pyrophosphate synthase